MPVGNFDQQTLPVLRLLLQMVMLMP